RPSWPSRRRSWRSGPTGVPVLPGLPGSPDHPDRPDLPDPPDPPDLPTFPALPALLVFPTLPSCRGPFDSLPPPAHHRGSKAFDYDARTRLMMFRGPFDATEWTSYHPDAERLFTAWANGLNAWVAEHADNLPVEFKLTGIKPEPWTARTVTLRWAELAVDSV